MVDLGDDPTSVIVCADRFGYWDEGRHAIHEMVTWVAENAPGTSEWLSEWREGPYLVEPQQVYFRDANTAMLFSMRYNIAQDGEMIWS